jgi:hypothetical protein
VTGQPAELPGRNGRHIVRLAGVVIGYSQLEDASPGDGRARGAFRPGIGYELVEPVFRLFAEAVPADDGVVTDMAKLDRYHESRDALGLKLEEPDGTVVATSAIHIADYSREHGPADRHLDVLISDDGYWLRRAAREAV